MHHPHNIQLLQCILSTCRSKEKRKTTTSWRQGTAWSYQSWSKINDRAAEPPAWVARRFHPWPLLYLFPVVLAKKTLLRVISCCCSSVPKSCQAHAIPLTAARQAPLSFTVLEFASAHYKTTQNFVCYFINSFTHSFIFQPGLLLQGILFSTLEDTKMNRMQTLSMHSY